MSKDILDPFLRQETIYIEPIDIVLWRIKMVLLHQQLLNSSYNKYKEKFKIDTRSKC